MKTITFSLVFASIIAIYTTTDSKSEHLVKISFTVPELKDLDTKEMISVVPLAVLMLFIGIYPSFVESYVAQDALVISNLIELFNGGLN